MLRAWNQYSQTSHMSVAGDVVDVDVDEDVDVADATSVHG